MTEPTSLPDWIQAVSVHTCCGSCCVHIALVKAFVCSQQPLVALASDVVVKLSRRLILLERSSSLFELRLPIEIEPDLSTVKWHRRSHELRLKLPRGDSVVEADSSTLIECLEEESIADTARCTTHETTAFGDFVENVSVSDAPNNVVKKRKKRNSKRKARTATSDENACRNFESATESCSKRTPSMDLILLPSLSPESAMELATSLAENESPRRRDSEPDFVTHSHVRVEEFPSADNELEQHQQSSLDTDQSIHALEQVSCFGCYEDIHASTSTNQIGNISIQGTFLHIRIRKQCSSKYRSKSEGADPDSISSKLSFNRYVNTVHFHQGNHLVSSSRAFEKLAGIKQVYRKESPTVDQSDIEDACSASSKTSSVVDSNVRVDKGVCPNSPTASTSTPPPSDSSTLIGSPHGKGAQFQNHVCDQCDFGEDLRTNQQYEMREHSQRYCRECDHFRTTCALGRSHASRQSTHIGSGSIIVEMRRRADGDFALATDVSTAVASDSNTKNMLSWRPTLRHLCKKEAPPAR